jgi:hypothetical protein
MYLSLLLDRRIHCAMGEYGPAAVRGTLQRTDQSLITIHQKRNLSAVIAESKPPILKFIPQKPLAILTTTRYSLRQYQHGARIPEGRRIPLPAHPFLQRRLRRGREQGALRGRGH